MEAGLAIAKLVAGMRKPTVHSFSAADIPSACRLRWRQALVHRALGIHDHSPVRMSGLMLWRAADAGYFQRIQDRITNFVTANFL